MYMITYACCFFDILDTKIALIVMTFLLFIYLEYLTEDYYKLKTFLFTILNIYKPAHYKKQRNAPSAFIPKTKKKKAFPYWHAKGDSILYDERVFPGGEGDEDPLYPEGRSAGHAGGNGGIIYISITLCCVLKLV